MGEQTARAGQESNQPRVWHMVMCSLNRQDIPLDWHGMEGTSHSHISLHPYLLDREWIPRASSLCPCSEHIYRSAGQRCKEEMQDLLLHSHRSGVHSLLLVWFTWRAPCVPWDTSQHHSGHGGARDSQTCSFLGLVTATPRLIRIPHSCGLSYHCFPSLSSPSQGTS